MDAYLTELFARPNDFELVDRLFLRISHHCDGSNLATLAALPETHRTILEIWGSKGIIDNGGLKYLLEGDFADFHSIVASFQRIGATDQANALQEVLAYLPDDETLRDYDRRQAFIDRDDTDIPWWDLSCQFFATGKSCERKLAAYARANQAAFKNLASVYPDHDAESLAELAEKDLPAPPLDADAKTMETWFESIDAVVESKRSKIVAIRFSKHRNTLDADLTQATRYRCCQSLRRLDLADSYVGKSGLAAIPEFAKLESLDLTRTETEDDWFPPWTGLPNLQELDLSETRITDRALDGIDALQNLQGLSLRGLSLTHAGYAKLSGLSLTWLMLFETPHDAATLKEIGRLTTLERLDLRQSLLPGMGLAQLAPLTNLRELDLGSAFVEGDWNLPPLPHLEKLNLHGTDFTHEMLPAIARMTALKELRLSKTNFEIDDRLLALAELSSLQKLRLPETAKGSDVAKRLRAALPKTKLTYY